MGIQCLFSKTQGFAWILPGLIEIRAIEFLTKKLISVNNLVKIEGKALTNPVAVPRGAGKGLAVRWPVSRVLFRFPGDGYSSSAAVAGRVEQPTRTAAQDRACRAGRHVSLHGLAPDGVYHARPVAGPAVRSYRTFSPLPPESGGLFSVALSLGSPPPGVTRHPDPVEPGLSSPRTARGRAAAIRPSDSAGIIGARRSQGQDGVDAGGG